MAYSLYSFTGQANQDPNATANLAQYAQQGQAGINPGQQMVAAADPIASIAQSGLGKALMNASAKQLPAQQVNPQAQQALAQGPQQTGTVGPTPQNLALANQLQAQSANPFASLPQSYGIGGMNG